MLSPLLIRLPMCPFLALQLYYRRSAISHSTPEHCALSSTIVLSVSTRDPPSTTYNTASLPKLPFAFRSCISYRICFVYLHLLSSFFVTLIFSSPFSFACSKQGATAGDCFCSDLILSTQCLPIIIHPLYTIVVAPIDVYYLRLGIVYCVIETGVHSPKNAGSKSSPSVWVGLGSFH